MRNTYYWKYHARVWTSDSRSNLALYRKSTRTVYQVAGTVCHCERVQNGYEAWLDSIDDPNLIGVFASVKECIQATMLTYQLFIDADGNEKRYIRLMNTMDRVGTSHFATRLGDAKRLVQVILRGEHINPEIN